MRPKAALSDFAASWFKIFFAAASTLFQRLHVIRPQLVLSTDIASIDPKALSRREVGEALDAACSPT